MSTSTKIETAFYLITCTNIQPFTDCVPQMQRHEHIADIIFPISEGEFQRISSKKRTIAYKYFFFTFFFEKEAKRVCS